MIPFNYHHLYYCYVLAQEKTFSKAAKELKIAQPTLSAQIKQFEHFLGVQIFEREPRGVILTEDGDRIIAYAKTIFDVGRELKDNLFDASSKGIVRVQIGVASHLPKSMAHSVLEFVLRSQPNAHLTVEEGEPSRMMEHLKLHGLDAVINDTSFQSPQFEGIENYLIGKIPIVFCGNKKSAALFGKARKDLKGVPMIIPTSQSQSYHAIQEYFLKNKMKPKIIAEIEDVELVRRLVMKGYGIAPLNKFSVLNAPGDQRLQVIQSKNLPKIYETVYLTRKARKYPHPIINKIIKKHRFK